MSIVNGWGEFPIGKLPHIYILGNILGIQIKDNTKIDNLSFYKKFIWQIVLSMLHFFKE